MTATGLVVSAGDGAVIAPPFGCYACEDPLVDESVESVGEYVASDPETLLEFDELGEAEKSVADYQPGPALPDDLECLRNRARLLAIVVSPEHGKKCSREGCMKLQTFGKVVCSKQPTRPSRARPRSEEGGTHDRDRRAQP